MIATQRSEVPRFEGWKESPLKRGEQLEPRSNIWPIGMVLYLLMTLTDVYKWMDETETISEEDFIRQGKHVIGPVQTRRKPEYSEQLRDLVRECLNPAVTKRPTVSRLITRTRAGLEGFRTRSPNGKDTTKVPRLVHLKDSVSLLPQGRPRPVRPKAADNPVAESTTPRTGFRQKTPTWQPRRGGNSQHIQRLEVPLITISSNSEVLPATLPSSIKSEQDGKRRRHKPNEDSGQSVPAKRSRIANTAAEVIAISDDTSHAENTSFHPEALPAANPKDREDEYRNKHLGKSSRSADFDWSDLANYGSSVDHRSTLLEEEDRNADLRCSKLRSLQQYKGDSGGRPILGMHRSAP